MIYILDYDLPIKYEKVFLKALFRWFYLPRPTKYLNDLHSEYEKVFK